MSSQELGEHESNLESYQFGDVWGDGILPSCLVDTGVVPLEAQHIRQFADINISTAILVEFLEGGLPMSAHFTDDSPCMEEHLFWASLLSFPVRIHNLRHRGYLLIC